MIIKVPFEDKQYRIGFTRATAAALEDAGFVAEEIQTKTVKTVTLVLTHAFRANHPDLSTEMVEKIWSAQKGKGKLLGLLVDSYLETIESLMGEEDGDEENALWEVEE